MRKVDILLTGQVLPGVDAKVCARRLASLAGIDEAEAEQMVNGKQLVRVKKEVDALTGLRYRNALAALGADVLLRPSGLVPRRRRIVRDEEPEEHSVLQDLSRGFHFSCLYEWQSEPRVFPARRGLFWLLLAWRMFKNQWLDWVALLFLIGALVLLAGFAPVLKGFLSLLLLPVFLGASMTAAFWQDCGESPSMLAPWAAVCKHWHDLTRMGLWTVLLLLGFGTLWITLDAWNLVSQFAALPVGQLTLRGLGLVLLLSAVPVLAGYLFAVPLIMLGNFRPHTAFWQGLYACLANWRPVVTVLAFLLSACTCIGLLAYAVQSTQPQWFGLFQLVLGLLLPLPLTAFCLLLLYIAAQDIFAAA